MTAIEAVATYLPEQRVPVERLGDELGLSTMEVRVFRRFHELADVCRAPGVSLVDLLLAAARRLDALRGSEHRVRYVLHARTFPVVVPYPVNPAASRCPPPPRLTASRPTSTPPLLRSDTDHSRSATCLNTQDTSASSATRTASISPSSTCRRWPCRARSSRVAYDQTSPPPLAADGSSTALASTSPYSFMAPKGRLSNSRREISAGLMPVASSRAASSCTAGVVRSNLNDPVSVASAT